jgi:uncharacterized protein YybS (DUF2232 family)
MLELNLLLFLFFLAVVCGLLLLKESETALDELADWAASRSYGLKCARAEHEQRKTRNKQPA